MKMGQKAPEEASRSITTPADQHAGGTPGEAQRVALVSAVNDLRRTPWPATAEGADGDGVISLIFGKVTGKGTPRDAALDVYLTTVIAADRPAEDVVMSHADDTLRRARQVAELGRSAASTMVPERSDIGLLESAINSARISRDMYVDALRELSDRGHDVAREDWKEVERAFDQTITDIGRAADDVSDRVAANEPVAAFAREHHQPTTR